MSLHSLQRLAVYASSNDHSLARSLQPFLLVSNIFHGSNSVNPGAPSISHILVLYTLQASLPLGPVQPLLPTSMRTHTGYNTSGPKAEQDAQGFELLRRPSF